MIATLYLPGAMPRPLTADELVAIAPYQNLGQHLAIGVLPTDVVLAKLLGTSIPCETLASGPNYLVVAPENAADYNFAATPSATADFIRLTGMQLDDDELVGPMLIIQA